MKVATIKIRGKAYKFDADNSWNKWKYILTNSKISLLDKVEWYVNNVMIDKPKAYRDVMEFVGRIDKYLKIDGKSIRDLMRNSGKVGRGCVLPEFSADELEYNVLIGMKGSVTVDLSELSFRKLIFFKRMIDADRQREADSYK